MDRPSPDDRPVIPWLFVMFGDYRPCVRRLPAPLRSRAVLRCIGLIAALLALGLLAPVSPAAAHTSPVASSPKPNVTIRAVPEDVTMTFDGPLDVSPSAKESLLVVTDPMHHFINAPTATIEGSTLSTVLSPTMLMDGRYTVSFRAWAADGFPSQGSWYFTVDAGATDEESDQPAQTTPVPISGTTTLAVTATSAGVVDGAGSPGGSATGTFDIDFASANLCYRITTRGLTDITAGHVHSANQSRMTISDEISLPIDISSIDAPTPTCSRQDPQTLAFLASDPARYVLMIHTQDCPEGAVAGPFTLVSSTATTPDPSSTLWRPIIIGQAITLLAVVGLLAMALVRHARRARRARREDADRRETVASTAE